MVQKPGFLSSEPSEIVALEAFCGVQNALPIEKPGFSPQVENSYLEFSSWYEYCDVTI
jgi:hypothetical protein